MINNKEPATPKISSTGAIRSNSSNAQSPSAATKFLANLLVLSFTAFDRRNLDRAGSIHYECVACCCPTGACAGR